MKSNNETGMSFCKKLLECVKEYKKQVAETNDDIDAAHFYDKKLKSWISDHMTEIDMLSTINLHKGFVTFIKHYLFND